MDASALNWQRGCFSMKGTRGGEWTANGEFVYGKWGISKREDAEEGRKFWNLTHLPTGACVLYTTEKPDAKVAAEILDSIADFEKVKRIEDARPYMTAFMRKLKAAGLYHHGGSRFERWEIGNDN